MHTVARSLTGMPNCVPRRKLFVEPVSGLPKFNSNRTEQDSLEHRWLIQLRFGPQSTALANGQLGPRCSQQTHRSLSQPH